MKFAGVDGYKGGWFAVITDGRSFWDIGVFESIKSVWALHNSATLFLIDIEMLALGTGLVDSGRRRWKLFWWQTWLLEV